MRDETRKAAALNYKWDFDAAPKLTAKGRGALAERIIAVARASGVPIKEDRELVEVLSAIELNREIPEDLYKAVAEILAFIYKLSKGRG